MRNPVLLIIGTCLACLTASVQALVNPVATSLLVEDWMATIYVVGETDKDLLPFCKGALIASQWVVTSGYCIVDPLKAYDSAGDEIDPEYRVMLGKSSELIAVTDFEYSDDYSIGLMRLEKPVTKTPVKLSQSGAASLLNKEVHILSTESSPIIRHSYFNPYSGSGRRMECNIGNLAFSTNSAAPDSAMCYILGKTTRAGGLYKTTAKVIDPEAAGAPASSLDKLGGFDKTGARLYLDFRASDSYPCNEDLGSAILVTKDDGSVELAGIVSAVGAARGLPMCSPVLFNKFSALAHYKSFLDTTMTAAAFAALCPSAPSIRFQYLEGNKLRVYWDAVAGATGYRIHYTTEVGHVKIRTLDVGSRTDVTTPIESGVDYTVALSSYNATCTSGLSQQKTL